MAPLTPTQLRLGFLSPHNPFDRRAFSGTVHFAAHALQNCPGISLSILGDFAPPRPVFDRIFKPHHNVDVSQLDVTGLDAVVGMVATPLLNDLFQHHPELPFVHVTDATPEFLRDAYGWQIPPEADILEARIAKRAMATVYSSDTIARRAGQDLGLPGFDPDIIPFGVNIDALPEICPKKSPLDRLELLFVGLDWMRKGGDIAIAALDALRDGGRDAHLSIIGTCPERHRNRPDVTYLGYLDKNRPRDTAKITAAYNRAHLLLLPSRADCTPMVISEAMAHGTPVIATDIGGVGSMIRASGGGRTMPEFSKPRDWAAMVMDITDDQAGYAFIADAGFDHVQTCGSWAAWARELEALLRAKIGKATAPDRSITAA